MCVGLKFNYFYQAAIHAIYLKFSYVDQSVGNAASSNLWDEISEKRIWVLRIII